MAVFTNEQREELKSLFAELVGNGEDPNIAQRQAAAEVAAKANANGDAQPDPAQKALSDQMATFEGKLNGLMEIMEKSPALKAAGYVTEGEKVGEKRKSLGGFLIAVKRRDLKTLTDYGSQRADWAVKDIESQDGTAGAYLIPQEYHAQILEAPGMAAVVRPRASVFPVGTDSGLFPALDHYTAPTAGVGDTAFASGVQIGATAPGGTLTETQPTFEQIEYAVRKQGAFTEVQNEVIADSPFAIEALLTRLFRVALDAKEDHLFLRGDGAGEPLGILNAAALINVTPGTNNTFTYTDALAMKARLLKSGGAPVWLMHPGVLPDVGAFEVSSGSGGVWIANLATSLPETILGYPYLESEHLPQDDNSGDVILAVLSSYAIFDREGMAVAFSEHAAFTSDKGTWRVTKRFDGQPWQSAAVTLADPQGAYTVSPFVNHND